MFILAFDRHEHTQAASRACPGFPQHGFGRVYPTAAFTQSTLLPSRQSPSKLNHDWRTCPDSRPRRGGRGDLNDRELLQAVAEVERQLDELALAWPGGVSA